MTRTHIAMSFFGVVTGILLGSVVQYSIAAWQGPTATPPGNNVAAPVNVSANLQIKTGPLGVNMGAATPLPGIGFEVNGSALVVNDLFVGNGVKVGTVTANCDATTGGMLRYNATAKCVEYCNETAWMCATGTSSSASFNYNNSITTNTANYNLRASLLGSGWDGVEPVDVTITINPGTYVYSTNTGVPAIDTGAAFPAGSNVAIVNNGYIVGKGGRGGASYYSGYGSNSPGQPGGPAIRVQSPITITNNGTIAGGGGGGGGGSHDTSSPYHYSSGGGGAGGGEGGGCFGTAQTGSPAIGGVGIGGAYLGGSREVNQGASGGWRLPGTGGAGTGQGTGAPGGAGSGGGGGGSSHAGACTGGNGGSAGAVGGSTGGGCSGGGGGWGAAGGSSIGAGGAGGAAVLGNSFVTWTTTGTRYGALN